MDMTALGVWYASAAWVEWSDANLTDYERIVAGSTAYTSASGVGKYYASAGARAALRGGNWDGTVLTGAFALGLYYAPSEMGTYVGFRCAR